MGPLLSVLAGPSGKASTMRLSTILVVVLVVGTWSIVSVQKQELQPMSAEHTALVLGVLMTKAYQHTSEKSHKVEQPK